MANRPRAIGTAAETAVARYLQDHGFAGAERRSLQGSTDKGDITGAPGLVWEVKAGRTLCLSEWLRQTEKERHNAKADFGILVVKPVGYGVTRVGKWWAVMRWGEWSRLVNEITNTQGRMPHHHVEELSGARITELRGVMRRLPEPQWAPRFMLPLVLINPKGVRDPMKFYVVTTMDQMVVMVRMAGYGDPYVIE